MEMLKEFTKNKNHEQRLDAPSLEYLEKGTQWGPLPFGHFIQSHWRCSYKTFIYWKTTRMMLGIHCHFSLAFMIWFKNKWHVLHSYLLWLLSVEEDDGKQTSVNKKENFPDQYKYHDLNSCVINISAITVFNLLFLWDAFWENKIWHFLVWLPDDCIVRFWINVELLLWNHDLLGVLHEWITWYDAVTDRAPILWVA